MGQGRRRSTPTGRRRLVRAACVGAFVVLLTTVSVAYATLSDSTAVSTTVSTATLAPPANPAVTQSCTPPASIVLRGATSARGLDALTLAMPAGTAGDVVVAQVANHNGLYGGITPPTGWALLDRRSTGTTMTSALFFKITTGTEPTAATFDLLNSTDVHMVGGIIRYSGVSAASPVNAWSGSTGSGGRVTLPSVTTTAPGTMLVHTIAKRREAIPAAAGTTQRWRINSDARVGPIGATGSDALFAGSGVTPTRTAVTDVNSEWIAHTVALRATPGTPTARATWTASASTWATGYLAERSVGGIVQETVPITPVSATSTTDGPLVNGTTYTYRLSTYHRSWTAPAVSVTFRPDCP